jgi:stage V sporulation protein K
MDFNQDAQRALDQLAALPGMLTSVLWLEKSRPNFGNARSLRNHIERSIRQHAVRVSKLTNPTINDLTTLRREDVVHNLSGVRMAEKEALQQMIRIAQNRLLELELKEILAAQS